MLVSGAKQYPQRIAPARVVPGKVRRWVESGDWALLLVDRRGRIHFSSASATAILLQASAARSGSCRFDCRWLPPLLLPLVERAWKSSLGCADNPSTLDLETSWGRFQFHASALRGGADSPAALIAVHVYRFEPLLLRISRGARRAGLSRRQLLVCRHLAAGRTYAEIALRMSIRPNTVIDHVRKVYARLDVHNHEQLWATLLTYGRVAAGVSRDRCST